MRKNGEKEYVIEARTGTGELDLTGKQPADYFGLKAYQGITDWEMSRIIYAKFPDALLTGDSIPTWPQVFDTRFAARQKTW